MKTKHGSDRDHLSYILALAALLLASLSPAQTYGGTRIGSIDVARFDSGELYIRKGHREWLVHLTKLIRTNDCAIRDPQICPGPPKSSCPNCPALFENVAWDERHQRFYFAFTTGSGWEKPWLICNYDLATRRVTRFTSLWAAALVLAEVSPSGQYLAYVKAYHHAPAAPCGSSSDIEIADLWNRSVASPALDFANSEGGVWIDKLRWPSHSSVEYTGSVRRPDCTAIPDLQVNGRTDVGSLGFH